MHSRRTLVQLSRKGNSWSSTTARKRLSLFKQPTTASLSSSALSLPTRRTASLVVSSSRSLSTRGNWAACRTLLKLDTRTGTPHWRSALSPVSRAARTGDMSLSVSRACLVTRDHDLTIVLFPRHFANAEQAQATINRIALFRDYLHYHIKCSKAYMHSRMRHRVAEFLKILNRAKPEVATTQERKTAAGRTFRQR